MSESRKLLIGFGVVLIVCCCAAGIMLFSFRQFGQRVQSAVNGDPTSVARAQADIAEFEVPAGYRPVVLNMFTNQVVMLSPAQPGDGMMIMMMQYVGAISGNREQMEQQLRQMAEQQSRQPGVDMQVVDTYEETIRGETVTVTVSEADYQGFTMRQWSTIFQGNRGPTLLMVQGDSESWDAELLENFIDSIH